ncbi:MAG: hypothetical protein ABIP30_15630 [Ferruginibacter sp.]
MVEVNRSEGELFDQWKWSVEGGEGCESKPVNFRYLGISNK